MTFSSRLYAAVTWLPLKIIDRLTLGALEHSRLGEIDGITVCDLTLTRKSPEVFLELTRQTLSYMQKTDARRHRRVCQQLRYIVKADLIGRGNFQPRQKICSIDYIRGLDTPDVSTNMRRYASILIHEATHGVVSEKGIPYDESHRERIERLCHAEEVRFLKHDHPEIAAAYPFDLEFYSRTWKYHVIMGVWNSLRRIWGVLPNAARAQLNLGIRHQKEGAWTDAIACFSRAIELDSNYAVAYSNRGHAYEQEGEFDLAIQDYTRAITLRPNSAVAYNNRGHVYYKKGDFNKALLDLAKVVQIDPKFALAYSNRAGTFKAMLKYDEAAADYARVIELCPEKYPAYNNLAWFWATRKSEEKRDGKKALEYAIKACEMSQWKNPSTIRTLAVAYAETGNFEEAAKWETVYLASPNLSSHSQKAGKYRLSLFQSGQPYRMEL